jgi:hypothetical protein
VSIPALGPTQPSIQWLLGALSAEVKLLEREADHRLVLVLVIIELYVQSHIRRNGLVQSPIRSNGVVQSPILRDGVVQSPIRRNGVVQSPIRSNGEALI